MASSYSTKPLFDAIDTNQDGKIDKDEFRQWALNPVEVSSSPYEPLNIGYNHDHTITSRLDRTTTISKDYISDTTIVTRSVEETELYLENHGIDLCKNPQIIRRTTPERPPTYEQRVSVRYLQPPPLPPSG
ncbi:unnamed protein product, partial [Rotaria sp. Silwood1]